MPTINRIAIFGTGRIGKFIYSGTDALCTVEKNTAKNNEDFLPKDERKNIVSKAKLNKELKVYRY